MHTLAHLNPLYHATEATRALLSGTLTSPAVPRAFLITAALTTLTLSWTVSRFRKVAA